METFKSKSLYVVNNLLPIYVNNLKFTNTNEPIEIKLTNNEFLLFIENYLNINEKDKLLINIYNNLDEYYFYNITTVFNINNEIQNIILTGFDKRLYSFSLGNNFIFINIVDIWIFLVYYINM